MVPRNSSSSEYHNLKNLSKIAAYPCRCMLSSLYLQVFISKSSFAGLYRKSFLQILFCKSIFARSFFASLHLQVFISRYLFASLHSGLSHGRTYTLPRLIRIVLAFLRGSSDGSTNEPTVAQATIYFTLRRRVSPCAKCLMTTTR